MVLLEEGHHGDCDHEVGHSAPLHGSVGVPIAL